MRVLIGCETSGVVRRAFSDLGHDAWSCDLFPALDGSNRHLIGDVREFLDRDWDLLAVFHPPCTRLCNSGVRWLTEPPHNLNTTYSKEVRQAYKAMSRDERLAFTWAELDKAAELFSDLWNAPINRVCVENPVMHRYARERIRGFRPAAQTVQPWWFGEKAFKGTGLYLRNLPNLVETNRLEPPKAGTKEHKEWSFIHRTSASADRWSSRSMTFPGIAAAMAQQWGDLDTMTPTQRDLFYA